MDDIISAADANRNLSRVLREVGKGKSYVVTSHGRPVARITPAGNQSELRTREAAKTELVNQLRQYPAQGLEKWSRDELYDE
jgi:prevent-host-death family protein